MTSPHFHFVKQFFDTNGCAITEESSSHMNIQLTNAMDEEIMNRPFYWHYMKKMNRQGEPMQLTFTEDTADPGIYLHAGTPKLHTIYETAMKKGRLARLYEAVNKTQSNGALTPWLVVNVLLHYRGKQTKDEPLSIGLQLLHGTFVPRMMERISNYSFNMTVSDYTFPMTPIIQLKSAYKRIEGYVENYTSSQNHTWARDSHQQLEQEEQLLQSFYESGDMSEDQFNKERDQLVKRYRPRIEMEVVNGGLFYLSQQTSHDILRVRNSNEHNNFG